MRSPQEERYSSVVGMKMFMTWFRMKGSIFHFSSIVPGLQSQWLDWSYDIRQISTDIGSIREVGEVQRDASIDGHHAVEEAETASNREEHSLIDNGNEEDDTIKNHEDINKGIEADGGLSKEVPFRFLGHQWGWEGREIRFQTRNRRYQAKWVDEEL